MDKKNNKKSKNTFSSLLNNNRFILILSLVIAFILWMWVAIEQSPEIQKVITGVPVAIKVQSSSYNIMLFVSALQESIGREFTESEITLAAKITMINVILISIVMAVIDYLRRKFK